MKQYTPLALRRLNSAISNFTAPSIGILTPPMATKFRTKSLTIKHPFTLIELLVVILIIGILAAILLPVFIQARNKARHSVDLSNLKQIATSAIIYTVDNKDLYPYREIWDKYSLGGQEYIKRTNYDERESMSSYLGDLNGILACPHAPLELDIEGSTAKHIRIDYSRYWGTGYNNESISMRMAGDPLIYDNKEFRVLASDYMEEQATKASWGSHEDGAGALLAQKTLSPILSSRWGSTFGASSRGYLDINFVLDDGHAYTMLGVISNDERLSPIPRNQVGDLSRLYKWLPPEE